MNKAAHEMLEGYMAYHNVSGGEDEECQIIRGVEICHPKPEVAHCSVDGTLHARWRRV